MSKFHDQSPDEKATRAIHRFESQTTNCQSFGGVGKIVRPHLTDRQSHINGTLLDVSAMKKKKKRKDDDISSVSIRHCRLAGYEISRTLTLVNPADLRI